MKPSSRSFDVQLLKNKLPAVALLGAALVATAVASGCAAQPGDMPSETQQPASAGLQQAEKAIPASGAGTARNDSAPGKPAKAARKIIYDARIDLVVESLNATEEAIAALIKDHDGLIAESDQSSVTATQRHATWRVRVPVDHFDAFVSAVGRLGEVRQNHVGSQDITEEFYDIEARIHNKREEEKRLIKHLADSTGKLEDILAVEKELSRVRGEIEQMEGRLRFLANRAELSTVTIEAVERKDYKPPIEAAFGSQLGSTFFSSVEALVQFGKTVLLIGAAVAPWLPLFVLASFAVRWLVRSGRGRTRPDGSAQLRGAR